MEPCQVASAGKGRPPTLVRISSADRDEWHTDGVFIKHLDRQRVPALLVSDIDLELLLMSEKQASEPQTRVGRAKRQEG